MSEARKLAAILVADIVGYSRLAGADEDRILAQLRTLCSDLIDPTISVHHDRLTNMRAYVAESPPSTDSTAPVINAAWFEHRNSTAAATSSGLPTRPSGTATFIWSFVMWK